MIAFAAIGFGLSAIAFLTLTTLLALHYRHKPGLRGLIFACAGTAFWAVASLIVVAGEEPAAAWIWPLDALHGAVWLVFLASLLPASSHAGLLRLLLPLTAAAAITFVTVWTLSSGPAVGAVAQAPSLILLVLALAGIWTTEQIYRNTNGHERRVLKPLCVAIGALLAYDMFVYSHGLLLGGLNQELWASRGFINSLVAVPLFVGAGRHPGIAPQLFLSRHLVLHSATLVGSGVYLIAMGTAGYLVRSRGGEWGIVLQITFLAAAVLTLFFVLSSSQLRARFKVFLAKHFYRYRYDYRDEWLRLIATLSDKDGGDAPQRALKAFMDILQSTSGQLWVSTGRDEPYDSVAVIGPAGRTSYSSDEPLVEFLARTNWIVDTAEYRANPERYSSALQESELPAKAVFVPLHHEDRLLGLARLDRPPGLGALNYEDHDLLKTVGRQMAVFLDQDIVRDRLAETRQFEAFNRTTAYLMHDLKNLMTQQALVVQNATRFKSKPEFIDDAIATIERGVLRMRKLLGQLQRPSADTEMSLVDLNEVLRDVITEAASGQPVPTLDVEANVMVPGNRDKFAMIMANAIRNAQDATQADGTIRVCATRRGESVVITIEDTGTGMDQAFVRDRLFRPFDSTKAASGMGIGAYQIKEYVTSLGGRVEVDSALGRGTCLSLIIPAEADSGKRAVAHGATQA